MEKIIGAWRAVEKLHSHRDLHPLTLRGNLPAGVKTGLPRLNYPLES
jgi:hypothetical protein